MTENQEQPRRRRRVVVRAALAFLLVFVVGWGATQALVQKAEEDHPPLGDFIEAGGIRHHYVDSGSGPPIVFVHGAFGALQDFTATVTPELSTRYRCIAWDRPGHGYSERPDGRIDPGVQAELLVDFVRALELDEPPLLVGFSYGGAVVLTAGMKEPDATRGLVLLNGPSHPWPDPIDFQYRFPTIPLVGPLLVETVLMPLGVALSSSSVEQAFAPLPVEELFLERSPISLSLRPDSYRANAEDIRSLKPFLARQSQRYEELSVPLTLVVSEGDLVVGPKIHSVPLSEAVPHFRMTRIDPAGHQILYTHPEIVIRAVDDSMRGE